MNARHEDGVFPDGTPPPADGSAIRIMVTLTPRTRTVEDVEIRHTRNIRPEFIGDVLGCVAAILKADGPGVISETGVIFGGIERER